MWCHFRLGLYRKKSNDLHARIHFKILQSLKHVKPRKLIHTLYRPPPNIHGADSQKPAEEDNTKLLDKDRIKEIQHIVEAILYYQRAIDCTVGVVLRSIASERTKATAKTKKELVFF